LASLLKINKFNGNANDQSGNGHDGIIEGAILASDRSDNENSAYYFNGNHQEIVVATKPITDQLTYLVWFKINSFSPDHATTIRHRQEGTADNHETIRIESNTRKLAFYLITENGHRGLAYGNFENRKNEWIHIVASVGCVPRTINFLDQNSPLQYPFHLCQNEIMYIFQ
jgi:hypothetical protein